MDLNIEQLDSSKRMSNKKVLIIGRKTAEKLKKCNQCNFASARNLSKHLKVHSGEKSNKCNQCDYAPASY